MGLNLLCERCFHLEMLNDHMRGKCCSLILPCEPYMRCCQIFLGSDGNRFCKLLIFLILQYYSNSQIYFDFQVFKKKNKQQCPFSV